jgi:hypothetical protein
MLLVLPAIVYFRDAIAGMLLIVVMGYSALYLLHARHAAFAHGAQVDPAQMVRYVYVMMPVTVLATARGIGHFTVLLRLSYQDRFSSAGMALLSFLGFALAAPSVYQQRASMAEDEIQNRLQVLVLDSPRRNLIYVSPYSAALVSALGREAVVVDWDALDEPAVLDWLRRKTAAGATLAIDPRLCGLTGFSTICGTLTSLMR